MDEEGGRSKMVKHTIPYNVDVLLEVVRAGTHPVGSTLQGIELAPYCTMFFQMQWTGRSESERRSSPSSFRLEFQRHSTSTLGTVGNLGTLY